MNTTGYSGIPLAKNLGIKKGFTVAIINEPSHYILLFEDMPEVRYLLNPNFESKILVIYSVPTKQILKHNL